MSKPLLQLAIKTACRIALLFLLANTTLANELRYSTVTGAGGLPLQIVEAGPRSAPGILFIHGWSLSSSSWQQLAAATAV